MLEVSVYILFGVAALMIAYMFIVFVYTIIITYKQTSEFINNLKVGDETNFGKISELDGDFVIIKREPLRIHRRDIQPKKFIANKLFFIGGN